jgi:hypothetical protein
MVRSKRNSERSLVETGIRLAFSVWRFPFPALSAISALPAFPGEVNAGSAQRRRAAQRFGVRWCICPIGQIGPMRHPGASHQSPITSQLCKRFPRKNTHSHLTIPDKYSYFSFNGRLETTFCFALVRYNGRLDLKSVR